MEKHYFDQNQPQGTMSLANLRNSLRALFQGDLMPLRPRATMLLDDMEYSSDANAANVWAGTGVTVTKTTTKHDGTYAVQMVIDGTGNRECKRTHSLNLSGFGYIKFWDYVNVAASAYQLLIRDTLGNESYWDFTTHATPSNWKQQSVNLSSPDSNNGTNADLSIVASWGFKGLDASKTYIFDNVEAICGMYIAISGASIAGYYSPIYIGSTHLSFAGGASPAISAPAANPRIDLLTIDTTGTLAWTTGTEDSSPVPPTYPAGKMPICLVYCKTTMTKVVNYEDASANPNEAYIFGDVRPLYLLGMSSFLALTDCPSSYAGQGLKGVRVNTGATALEFFTMLLSLMGDVNLSSLADGNVLKYNISTGKWENKKPYAVYK